MSSLTNVTEPESTTFTEDFESPEDVMRTVAEPGTDFEDSLLHPARPPATPTSRAIFSSMPRFYREAGPVGRVDDSGVRAIMPANRMRAVSREGLRFFVLVGLTVGLLAITIWAASTGRLTEEKLQALVAAGGIWSPILFVVIATLGPVAWVPRMMTSIVAGALFGLAGGSALALVGGVGGGLAGYGMGRSLGHDYVMKKIGPRGKAVAEFLGRRGLPAIALGRISPITNCAAISLGSGLIGLPLRIYVPATIVGMLPGSILYAAFGAAVLTEDAAWTSAVSGAVALVLAAGTGWWLWRMWLRDKAEQQELVARASRSSVSTLESASN